jgi:cytochrome bd-type quinol oxidase subunit 2
MTYSDGLVYFALGGVVVMLAIAAMVLVKTTDAADPETRRVRFAAATFTGILMMLILVSTMWYVDPRGKDICEKILNALSPLAGVIIGYFFGSKGTTARVASKDSAR